MAAQSNATAEAGLIRGLGLAGAIALNVNLMVGVGPFITMPLVVEAMGGPQAILGWVLGALLAVCDGLVVAELGAAMPDAGGSYAYIRDIYGPSRLGKLLSFLYVWQLSFSAPLSLASGAIGFSLYAAYLWPRLLHELGSVPVTLDGWHGSVPVAATTLVAMGVCVAATVLAYRRIDVVGRAAGFLFWGVLGTILWTILAGFTHFQSRLAFDFPPGAFQFSAGFLHGLGAAMLVTSYDYWGYYNVCFLGGEVRDPGRTIPRAVILSILLVATLYLMMTVAVLGVIPWREMLTTAHSEARRYIIAAFMERVYGVWAGRLVTALITRRRRPSRESGPAGDGPDSLDGLRLRVFAATGLLACSLRRRPGWELFSRVRAIASAGAVSGSVGSGAGRGGYSLLPADAAAGHCCAGRHSTAAAVSGAGGRRAGAALEAA